MSCSARRLFNHTRASLGFRKLCKNLGLIGFKVGRYHTRSFMHKLKIVVEQRQACEVAITLKHSNSFADNLLNRAV
jgi:putative transposase